MKILKIRGIMIPLLLACLLCQAIPLAAGQEMVEPSEVFPLHTLVYVELPHLPRSMDCLSRMDCRQEIESLLEEMAGAPQALMPSMALLTKVFAAWGNTPALRDHLEILAARHFAFGTISIPGSDRLETVCLFQGNDSGDPVASLGWIADLSFGSRLVRFDSDPFQKRFWIVGDNGKKLFVGCKVKGWVLCAEPSGAEEMEAMAAALSSRTGNPYFTLSENSDYPRVMSRLPASANMRAFLNIPSLLPKITSSKALSPMAEQWLKISLDWCGPIGVARRIDHDCIRTWVTGQMLQDKVERTIPGFMDSIGPVEKPLSPWFPETALLAYEAGFSVEKMFHLAGMLLKESAPRFFQKVKRYCQELTSTMGAASIAGFFSSLDPALAVAWLPAKEADAGWVIPRGVALLRVKDREKAQRFLYDFIQWEAGAIAPFTNGMVSAMTVLEEHEGVTLVGLKLDSILTIPLPSPTFALVNDLLVLSPFRSAVEETVSSIHENTGRITERTLLDAGPIQPDAVELVHLNFNGWEKDWDKWWNTWLTVGSLLLLDREFAATHTRDREGLHKVGKKLCRLLAVMDRATGSTTIGPEGWFTFFIELRIR